MYGVGERHSGKCSKPVTGASLEEEAQDLDLDCDFCLVQSPGSCSCWVSQGLTSQTASGMKKVLSKGFQEYLYVYCIKSTSWYTQAAAGTLSVNV